MTLIFIFLTLLFWAGPSAAEVVDRIVAQVNDEIITMSDLESMGKTLQAQSGPMPRGKEGQAIQRQMLDALIDRKLTQAEAKKRGLNVSDKELDQALQDFKRRNNFKDDATLNQALSQAGLTIKDLRQQIAEQIQQERMVQMAVGAKVTISEAAMRRYYEESFKEGGGEQLHLRMIKMPYPPGATDAQKEEVARKAEQILNGAKQGAAFPDLAKKYEVSETDMGFISQKDVAPELLEYLKRVKPREVVPVQTPQGIQLIQFVARRTGGAGSGPSFEQAAPEIRRILSAREMERHFSEWVKGLRAKAHIKIML
jgi:peptidyl-prolyl cis-trans isomerase SurA